MYELYWKALFLTGILTTTVSIWNPEPEATVYSAIMSLGIWTVLAFGSTNLVVYSGGQQFVTGSNVIAYLFGINALIQLIPLFVGIADWYDEESDEDGTAGSQGNLDWQ